MLRILAPKAAQGSFAARAASRAFSEIPKMGHDSALHLGSPEEGPFTAQVLSAQRHDSKLHIPQKDTNTQNSEAPATGTSAWNAAVLKAYKESLETATPTTHAAQVVAEREAAKASSLGK